MTKNTVDTPPTENHLRKYIPHAVASLAASAFFAIAAMSDQTEAPETSTTGCDTPDVSAPAGEQQPGACSFTFE